MTETDFNQLELESKTLTPEEMYNSIPESRFLKLDKDKDEFEGVLISYEIMQHPAYGALVSGNFSVLNAQNERIVQAVTLSPGLQKELREVNAEIGDTVNIFRKGISFKTVWIVRIVKKYDTE